VKTRFAAIGRGGKGKGGKQVFSGSRARKEKKGKRTRYPTNGNVQTKKRTLAEVTKREKKGSRKRYDRAFSKKKKKKKVSHRGRNAQL